MPRKKKIAKRPKKNMLGRPRGGASVACPTCDSDSEVIITRRDVPAGGVVRTRMCKGAAHHTFDTLECVR